jgi:hypothetical protein
MKKNLKPFLNKLPNLLPILGIIFISFIIKLLLLGNQLQNRIFLSNTLDFSWTSDSVERLTHGFVAGRDFVFTYGPLFQIFYSIPSLLFHYPSYYSPLIASLFLQIPLVIAIYIIAGFVNTNKKNQIILTLILQFVVGLLFFPDSNTLVRILLPFLFAVIYSASRKSSLLQKVFALSLPSVMGLYIFDNFLLCIIIFIFIEIYFFTTKNNNRKSLKNNLVELLVMLLGKLLIVSFFEIVASLILSNGIDYISASVDTVRSYQYIMNIPFSMNKNIYLFIYVFCFFFLYWYVIMKIQLSKAMKNNIIIFSFISLLQLKSFLIRSDDEHLLMGIYPSILMVFIFMYIILQERRKLFFLVLFCILIAFIPYKINIQSIFSMKSIEGLKKITTTQIPFFNIYTLPKNYYYLPEDFNYFSTLIKNNKKHVMVYPYDTYILNINHTTFNTYALQFYEYSNSYVEKITVDKLQKNPPHYIILGIDTKSAVVLDDIPNFSRNPRIAKWMITNYSVYKTAKNYLILIHYNNKAKETITDRNCVVYEIDTSSIIKFSFFENFIKTGTYYLDLNNEKNVRLPYSPFSNTLLFVEGATDRDKLAQIFSQKRDFSVPFITKMKEINIIKKYPIPKIKKFYTNTVTVTCY